MSTERLVKWSKEAKEFFEKAEDNSVILDLVISFGCASQTGEGFEELVNTINSEEIRRKVKKAIITDTSYLYRHDNPEFSKYADPTIETEWFIKNRESIKKLKVEKEVKPWAVSLNTQEFEKWNDKIRKDFEGDKNGKDIILEFRDKVMQASSVAAYKNNTDIKGCIEFTLEEIAYSCAFLKGSALVYPSGLAEPIAAATKCYKININPLTYKLSKQAQKNLYDCNLDMRVVDKSIVSFMKDSVTNVNFYVIDKHGNQVYKNYPLSGLLKNEVLSAKNMSNDSWRNTVEVIKQQKQLSFEEVYKDKTFVSVKSPLIINEKVEGVIGLSIDISDKKKAEELENKLKMQKELYNVARWVSHDIAQPVTVLKGYLDLNESLSEEERRIFKEATRSIENIAERLLVKYRDEKDEEESQYVLVPWCLERLVNQKREQYKEVGIEIRSSEDREDKFEFIRGNFIDFSRMITNLINNGIEAIEGKKGKIEVSYKVKGEEVEIRVKDNGKGMPQEMAEKMMKGEEIGTTKREGHGIGMQQIMGTIKAMSGKVKIESKENVGTEFVLRFPKTEKPRWFAEKVEIKKGDTVVILDDEPLIHAIWKEKLKEYEEEIEVKYFTKGVETLKFLKGIEDKDKVFLITDYELRGQDINGINVIEKSGMKDRHILITNAYLSEIKDFNEKSGYLRIFHKMYMNDIEIKSRVK